VRARARAVPWSVAPLVRWTALSLAGVVLLLFFAAVLERVLFSGDVMPGVDVAGVDIAGKSERDAFTELSALAARLETAPVRARVGERVLVADPSVLGIAVDEHATLRAARQAARSGNPFEQTLGAVLRRVRSEEIPLRVTYSRGGLEGVLDGWERETLEGAVDGNLRFEGTTVIEVTPRRGVGIRRDDARSQLERELQSPTRETLTLTVGTVAPRVSVAAVHRAAEDARELLEGTHDLVTDGATLTITAEQLVTALGTRVEGDQLELTIDAEKLRAALGASLTSLELAPVGARFAVTSSNSVQVVPSQNGRQVDLEGVATAILAGQRTITAPIEDVVPDHDTAWAEGLGITEQVSTFTTNHPTGQSRVTNIHRAADLINNLVVEPGQTFSLNDAIGPRTIERGFVQAPVFYGEFTEDVGGGVSQLATTFFNAVFWGGYEDVYHKPHTIYITRYPMGREATVNYGTVDLTFRNDSQHGILIRTGYTAGSITVTFYGDKEGKTVREEGRRVLAQRPVETRYFDCPGPEGLDEDGICATLPLGTTKQAEDGHEGIDVEFFRVIERPGVETVRERFFWSYRMTPNQILVGVAPPVAPPPPIDPSTPTTGGPTAGQGVPPAGSGSGTPTSASALIAP
jgi:vancomycin resistance protein YoaR